MVGRWREGGREGTSVHGLAERLGPPDQRLLSSPLHQQSLLTLQGTLQPEPPQDARFGFAMSALPDLNQDGFADVAVGAPLEDGHHGALYLYHGAQSGIRPRPAQVRSVQRKQGHGWEEGEVGCAPCSSLFPWP